MENFTGVVAVHVCGVGWGRVSEHAVRVFVLSVVERLTLVAGIAVGAGASAWLREVVVRRCLGQYRRSSNDAERQRWRWYLLFCILLQGV